MVLDYLDIGKRIARRRRQLNLTQAQVEEKANMGYKYLSNVERGVSIPSTEVIMRLAKALDTTPDEFLVGTMRVRDEEWKNVAEYLRLMNPKQLEMAKSFLQWLSEQNVQ